MHALSKAILFGAIMAHQSWVTTKMAHAGATGSFALPPFPPNADVSLDRGQVLGSRWYVQRKCKQMPGRPLSDIHNSLVPSSASYSRCDTTGGIVVAKLIDL